MHTAALKRALARRGGHGRGWVSTRTHSKSISPFGPRPFLGWRRSATRTQTRPSSSGAAASWPVHAGDSAREPVETDLLKPLVILGASGSGKSSLLKAGIIPRLRREAPAWIPLRAFRPGADPLLNFAEAITKTLADFGQTEAHGVLRSGTCSRRGRKRLAHGGRADRIGAGDAPGSVRRRGSPAAPGRGRSPGGDAVDQRGPRRRDRSIRRRQRRCIGRLPAGRDVKRGECKRNACGCGSRPGLRGLAFGVHDPHRQLRGATEPSAVSEAWRYGATT